MFERCKNTCRSNDETLFARRKKDFTEIALPDVTQVSRRPMQTYVLLTWVGVYPLGCMMHLHFTG